MKVRRIALSLILVVLIAYTAFAATQYVVEKKIVSDLRVFRAEASEDASTISFVNQTNYANVGTGWVSLSADDDNYSIQSNIELMFSAGAAADKTFTATILARMDTYAPVRRVAVLTCTTGTAQVVKYPVTQATATNKFWVDTIGITSYWATEIKDMDASGGNGIASVVFDTLNYKHWKIEITNADGTTGTEAANVMIYYRLFN